MTPKTPDVKPGLAIRKHATQIVAAQLRRFAFEVNRAARPGNAGAVHDLRVSIRRLAQCLRLFAQFFPGGKAKKIRSRLKPIMTRAAEVRNRDVALDLLKSAGVAAPPPVIERLKQERERAHRLLVADLRHWNRRRSFKKWRAQLEL